MFVPLACLSTCLIIAADWYLSAIFLPLRHKSISHLSSNVRMILTKAGDCFWELAVWSCNFQMACKDFERSPAGSLSLLVRCLPSDIYFDSGTSQLKLQVSRPRCTAMIDCNTLTFSGLSSKRLLTCSPPLGESYLLGCPCILDPYMWEYL